jgi:TolB-like protein/DNA-binding winged helix-turn-helix (wHTH) protein
MAVEVFQFGEYKLDCNRFELCRAGYSLKLERKPMELLILLASRRGELVSREEIAERLWGQEVFVDTEHGTNTAIRKIRYALRDDPEQPRFVQTVMGKGYRFVGSAEALLPSTNDGNQKLVEPINGEFQNGRPENGDLQLGYSTPVKGRVADASSQAKPFTSPGPAAEREAVTSKPGLRMWLGVAGAVAVALLALLATVVILRDRRAALPQIRSLAVLPLDNLSGDREQDYFADGMTDELTTMLAKNSTLRVVSRTSAMQYKGAHRPLREIAQTLGVDGIVEGSVERTNDKVHMTLQLIHGQSDTHLWAESYDRNANDVVSLPDEAAMAIAKKTNSTVAQPALARYVNPEAHDAYLHGRYLWFGGRNDEAEKYFQKAVALQPDYALAWSGVADYYLAGMVGGDTDPREARQPAEAAAQKAVELDDSLPAG